MNSSARIAAQERAITKEVTQLLAGIKFDALPEHVVTFAKHCFLDWLGVTIAGAREPLTEILRQEATEQGGAPVNTLIGTGEKTSPQWAALINGAAGHALDFDDVVSAMGGHPSVPVFPALLAEAERTQADGKAFIAAFVAGFEAECRVGSLMAPGHYARGFHATGTVGAFGAAAACAHLAGLDQERWQVAFGIAGAQAAGLKCMFGTMTKPFHAGKAAVNGLLAARLAAKGFTAHPDVLETEQGFAATQTDTPNFEAPVAPLQEYGITKVLFKYHAACYLTHATTEAVKSLRATHQIDPEAIERIHVTVPPGHLRVCNIQNPTTGLEGKFSLRFTTALAMLRDDTGERAFTDEAVNHPELVALRDKVSVEGVTTLANNYQSEVVVSLKNGETLRAVGDVSVPATPETLPQQWEKLAAKFTSLVEPLLGTARTADLIERIERLDSLKDVGELLSLTRFDA